MIYGFGDREKQREAAQEIDCTTRSPINISMACSMVVAPVAFLYCCRFAFAQKRRLCFLPTPATTIPLILCRLPADGWQQRKKGCESPNNVSLGWKPR